MTTDNSLEDLAKAAQRDGWAATTGTVDEIRRQAIRLSWTEVPTRRGDPPVSQLQPTTETDAHLNSLSAKYGLGMQPLHTDGAHLERPPEFVVLFAEHPTPTPTLLYRVKFQLPGSSNLPWSALWSGMFQVHNWRDSFFAPAHDGFLRYDPGCMTPCDQRAHQVASFFDTALADVRPHEWSTPGQVLVIHNWSTLHARAAVAPDDTHRVLTRIAFAPAVR